MSANLSLHSAPDAIEPVVAWRTWRVNATDEGLRLTPIAYHLGDTVWPARKRFEATCRKFYRRGADHVAPSRVCVCGIYASKTVKGAHVYANEYAVMQSGVVWVAIGRVNMWGKIAEHEHGYRAQYAYPKQLLLPDGIGGRPAPENLTDIADELREAYGVPTLIVHPQKPTLLERLKGIK